jgi:hypothetical protein
MNGCRRINMWSGPRNVSTAMMYAWRQRSDTSVWDEPMYGHYLSVTGIQHPEREAVLEAMPTDRGEIVYAMAEAPCPTPVRFYKSMAHHLIDFDMSIVDRLENFLLTRDPRDQLPSLAKGLGRVPTMQDAAFGVQVELVDRMLASGRTPIVVDSAELLTDPESVLSQLCALLDLPYEAAMLSWPPGPKSEDGVWASHWYAGVHASTGFSPHQPKTGAFPAELEAIYAGCEPLYRRLSEFAIRA